jgi:hypothetical protein
MISSPGSGDVPALRRISRISEQNTSIPPKPKDGMVIPPTHDHSVPEAEAHAETFDPSPIPSLPVLDPILPLQPMLSRRASLNKRESELFSEPNASPAISETPSSARDLDTVLDYYSQDENSPDPPNQGFRPVFSPIREETSSQLSPASPYRPKKTPSTGKSYLGATPSPFSAGGTTYC